METSLDTNLESELEALLAQEAHEPDAINGNVALPSQRARKNEYYRILRKDDEDKGHKAGMILSSKNGEQFQSTFATLLYTSPIRKVEQWKDRKLVGVKCQSHNGEAPSARIEKPFCHCVTKEQIEQTLLSFNIEKAQILKVLPTLTDGGEYLTHCAYKNPKNNALYPLCPAARPSKNTTGDMVPSACKLQQACMLWDYERKVTFRVDLDASETRPTKDYIPPFLAFLTMTSGKKLPFYYYRILFSGAQNPKGRWIYNFSEAQLLVDATEREDSYRRASEVRNDFLNQQMWIPTKKSEEADKEE